MRKKRQHRNHSCFFPGKSTEVSVLSSNTQGFTLEELDNLKLPISFYESPKGYREDLGACPRPVLASSLLELYPPEMQSAQDGACVVSGHKH